MGILHLEMLHILNVKSVSEPSLKSQKPLQLIAITLTKLAYLAHLTVLCKTWRAEAPVTILPFCMTVKSLQQI